MKRVMLPLGPAPRTVGPPSSTACSFSSLGTRENQESTNAQAEGGARGSIVGATWAEGAAAAWEPQQLIVPVMNSADGGRGGADPTASSPVPFTATDSALKALEKTLVLSTAAGGFVGLCAALRQVDAAMAKGDSVSSRQLATTVSQVVASTVAGTLTGAVLGPLQAIRTMGGVFARPLLAGFLIHRSVLWVKRRCSGALALIRKMQSDDFIHQLEAVRSILSQALQGDKFRREFDKYGGMERLVKILSDSLQQLQAGSPLVVVIVHALEALMKSSECKDSFVAAGGVRTLVRLLGTRPATGGCTACMPSAAAVSHALSALSLLVDHPMAQDAIRETGGLSVLVGLAATGRPTSPNTLQAVSLLQSLALDPANKEEIGQAGGVGVILNVVQAAQTGSQLQSEAVLTLHTLLRGSPGNQRELASTPGAVHPLRQALAGLGPYWQPCKPDLHALLNVLARFPSGACHQLQQPVAAVAAPVVLASPPSAAPVATAAGVPLAPRGSGSSSTASEGPGVTTPPIKQQAGRGSTTGEGDGSVGRGTEVAAVNVDCTDSDFIGGDPMLVTAEEAEDAKDAASSSVHAALLRTAGSGSGR